MITAELLPVSLLTPMARGLAISEGLAGQTVSAVALAAIVSSLLVTTVTRGIDRRTVLLVFSVVQIVSCVIVAAAPNFTVVIIGRVILGLAVGGFWAMSASLAMRLSRQADVPIALSIVFGGLSASMIIAAPAASLLEVSIGWRGIFYIAATLGIPCLVWQWLALPSMPPFSRDNQVGDVFAIFRRPGIAPAMVAMFTAYAGHFAVYNFIRPLFELRGGLSASGISLALVIFGIANFAGTSLSSALLKCSLKFTLAVVPFTMAVAAIGLLLLAGNHRVAMSITAIWGAAMGCLPVAWSTWITRNLGDDAENAGAFQVALIQLSNVVGTAFAGAAFNFAGIVGPTTLGTLLLGIAAVIVIVYAQAHTPQRA
jgi:DHA1 family purine ribonucleoside efflux pump-like MFS transporter